MRERLVSAHVSEEEQTTEGSLRPRRLPEYIGQEKIKENLSILLEAARRRNEAVDHVLLYGPPGLGKTTLCNIIAAEMGVNLRTTSGPAGEHAGDLASTPYICGLTATATARSAPPIARHSNLPSGMEMLMLPPKW